MPRCPRSSDLEAMVGILYCPLYVCNNNGLEDYVCLQIFVNRFQACFSKLGSLAEMYALFFVMRCCLA